MSNDPARTLKPTVEQAPHLLREWFDHYVDRFRAPDGSLPPALELKYRHSLRVAADARAVAKAAGWPSPRIRLAEACGLVHDVGRFAQYADHGSFNDADTLDHGAAGRKLLENEGLPEHFGPALWPQVACAVAYHNRGTADIPPGIDGPTADLLGLIRDADKLDIMDLVLRSVARDGFSDLPDMLPHIRLDRAVTPDVLTQALSTRSVAIGTLHTLSDFLVMIATWFHDFNNRAARQMAVERGIVQRLRQVLPDSPALGRLFQAITTSADPPDGMQGAAECEQDDDNAPHPCTPKETACRLNTRPMPPR
ncbi:HD domain-containing protein [Desulfatitalea alkaliphila]|uniref:HD domain-containing protein n=1 Tax=Desulfatitalea alkaliphila TaxID=2929485 RepID=A0AA41RDK0_9BACT|nr:HD domain-containing protein [Desulfatitalea alkaliphila]MCJ8502868.1 HD domain-containing protein [Desulfatitalea alkaliphila]